MISVIIPVFNVEEFLEKCINSVISQTYTELEIILVDDGSTDNSGKICDEYAKKDDRIKVIHKQNEGQGVARNYALDICKGDYIAFVDSDDYIELDMFEIMLKAIDSDNYDIAICGVKFLECETGRIRSIAFTDSVISGDSDLLIQRYLTGKCFSVMWNKLYKAQLFENLRFPSIRSREDAYVLPELLGSVKKFIEIPDCKYIQNIREGSTERKPFSIEKLESTRKVLLHQNDYIKENYPDYYDITLLNLIRMYYGFLKEVVIRNNAKREDGVYIELFKCLKEEFSKIDIEILTEKQKEEMKKYSYAVNYPKKFYLESKVDKLKSFLKKQIKAFIGYINIKRWIMWV